jgi:hypothetical protein
VRLESFWPPADATQISYERLRAYLLEHGVLPQGLPAARFGRHGLAGLLGWPDTDTDPMFQGQLHGAARPAWTPHLDPRISALASGYQYLLAAAAEQPSLPASMLGGAR